MSRFGRDYIESSNYIETIFPFLGVRFISVSDHFDTEVEYNQNKALEIALKNLVNDMYAKDISKRVSVSRRLDMERGKFTGSNAPYGYKVDSGDALRKYVIDRDAAAVVRQIFELAADGVTLREIAKALQEYRLALPGDYLKTGNLYVEEGTEAKSWYPGTISNILKNQAYIGNMVQGKRRISLYDNEARHATDENDWIVVENTHEAIVDKELFNKVRAVMDKKVEESIFTSDRGKNLPIKEDIFAGILFCGNCGRRIPLASRILEKDGVLERQYFYSCRYNYDFGGKQCGCTIMEQELIKVVHNLLTTQAIISRMDFDAVQILMRRDTIAVAGKSESYMYAGILYCGDCGSSMVHRKESYKGREYINYICSNYNRNGKDACSRHCIREEDLNQIVLGELQGYINSMCDCEKVLAHLDELNVNYDEAVAHDKEIVALKQELTKCSAFKASLYQDLRDEIIRKEQFTRYREEFSAKERALEQAVREQETIIRDRYENGIAVAKNLERFREGLVIGNLDRVALVSFIDRILIYDDFRVEIVFKYRQEMEKVAGLFDVANEKDAEPVYTMVDGLPVIELKEAV